MTKTFSKNGVVLGDQLDKLKENLRGEALKGIPSHIHKLYLKDKYFCPDHNYTLENWLNFFIWEKEVKN